MSCWVVQLYQGGDSHGSSARSVKCYKSFFLENHLVALDMCHAGATVHSKLVASTPSRCHCIGASQRTPGSIPSNQALGASPVARSLPGPSPPSALSPSTGMLSHCAPFVVLWFRGGVSSDPYSQRPLAGILCAARTVSRRLAGVRGMATEPRSNHNMACRDHGSRDVDFVLTVEKGRTMSVIEIPILPRLSITFLA